MATRRSSVLGLATAVAALAIILAGCTAGGAGTTGGAGPSTPNEPTASASPGGSPSPGGSAVIPPSASGSAVPIATPSATSPTGTSGTPRPAGTPSAVTVTTAQQAARLVLASDPRFASIGPYDPNLIGQAAWYRAAPKGTGFEVVVRIGWGDCPSGCIDEHVWTYAVSRPGQVTLVGESGSDVPADVIGGTGGTGGSGGGTGEPGLSGRVTAGPTCPVERVPPDPACAPRAVAGAVLVVTDGSGREVARTTSDTNGDFAIALQPGSYVLTPQPVVGLMGTAQPAAFTLATPGASVTIDVEYDTGIR